jgi:hypothetical protein
MLGKFWGKSGSSGSKRLDAVNSRGLEVVDDDPETVWSLWDNAVTEQESRSAEPAPLERPTSSQTTPMPRNQNPHGDAPGSLASAFDFSYDEPPTQPHLDEEASNEQRAIQAFEVVNQFHPRIATTIRTFWGHRECTAYINKLIMEGDDGLGNARSGFNPQAVQAMMELTELHEAIFGPMEPQGSSFSRL